jgi:UDP-N-acetylmuramoylalanine-D-glutamate ligase
VRAATGSALAKCLEEFGAEAGMAIAIAVHSGMNMDEAMTFAQKRAKSSQGDDKIVLSPKAASLRQKLRGLTRSVELAPLQCAEHKTRAHK